MSAAGVLAVMEREAMDRMSSGFPRQADELHEAHAAVAELIELNRRLIDAAPDAWWKGSSGKHLSDIRDFLARVGGGA